MERNEKGKFIKGNSGKPLGTKNQISQKTRELFLSIIEYEVANIKGALEELRKRDSKEYLDVLAKFLPYFLPKQTELDFIGDAQPIITWIIESVEPKHEE